MNTQEDAAAEMAMEKTKAWIEKAVIGLNLCPFTKSVYIQKLIRYTVSSAQTEEDLLGELRSELELIVRTPASEVDTTLLIHPGVLNDFLEYNDFLGVAEELVAEMGLEGVIQVASFHPRYQFAGTDVDDITNFTNRAPYPILHLLREESVSKAVDSFPGVDDIPDKNMETLRRLGLEGWKKLGIPTA